MSRSAISTAQYYSWEHSLWEPRNLATRFYPLTWGLPWRRMRWRTWKLQIDQAIQNQLFVAAISQRQDLSTSSSPSLVSLWCLWRCHTSVGWSWCWKWFCCARTSCFWLESHHGRCEGFEGCCSSLGMERELEWLCNLHIILQVLLGSAWLFWCHP